MHSGIYRLHSNFDRVLNYTSRDGSLLSLVRPEIGAGPGNIVLTDLPDPAPPYLEVTEEHIRFGAQSIARARLKDFDPRLFIESLPSPDKVDDCVRVLLPRFPPQSLAFLFDPGREQEFETGSQQALRDRLKEGVRLLLTSDPADGARILKGLGYGLTPSGDDFLCGYLYALALEGPAQQMNRDAIFDAARSDNILVNHFLRAAHRGWFYEHFKAFTRALCEGSGNEVLSAFEQLLTVGATSGADTAAGLIIGLRYTTPATSS